MKCNSAIKISIIVCMNEHIVALGFELLTWLPKLVHQLEVASFSE